MEVEGEEGETIEGETSGETAGGGSRNQDKPRELKSLAQDQSEEEAGDDSGSGSRFTPCLLTKALKLPTIKEMLESLDQ